MKVGINAEELFLSKKVLISAFVAKQVKILRAIWVTLIKLWSLTPELRSSIFIIHMDSHTVIKGLIGFFLDILFLIWIDLSTQFRKIIISRLFFKILKWGFFLIIINKQISLKCSYKFHIYLSPTRIWLFFGVWPTCTNNRLLLFPARIIFAPLPVHQQNVWKIFPTYVSHYF